MLMFYAADRTRPPLPPSTDRGTFDPTGPLASPTDTTTFSKNNTGVIVGAVVGGVAGAGLLAGLAAFVVTRKRRAKDAASAGDTKLGAGKDPYSGSAGTTTKGLGASPETSLAVGGDALAIVSSDGQTAKQANPADTVPTAATTASMTLQPESTVSLEQPTKVSGVQLTGVDSTATLTTSATLTGSLDSYAVYQVRSSPKHTHCIGTRHVNALFVEALWLSSSGYAVRMRHGIWHACTWPSNAPETNACMVSGCQACTWPSNAPETNACMVSGCMSCEAVTSEPC